MTRFIDEVTYHPPSLEKLPGLKAARDRIANRVAPKKQTKQVELPKFPEFPTKQTSIPKFSGDPGLEKRVLSPTIPADEPPVHGPRPGTASPDRDNVLKQANDARTRAHQYLKMYKDASEVGHREKAAYLKKQYNAYWQIWRDLEGKLKK